jgi:uncharacterized protein (DUF427 family)
LQGSGQRSFRSRKNRFAAGSSRDIGDSLTCEDTAVVSTSRHLPEIRMKATWNGAVLAESDDIIIVEGNHYFPESSLKREFVTFSNHRTSCPWKGQAYYYTLFVDGEMNPEAVWYYPEPTEAAANIKGRVAFWKGVKVE